MKSTDTLDTVTLTTGERRIIAAALETAVRLSEAVGEPLSRRELILELRDRIAPGRAGHV